MDFGYTWPWTHGHLVLAVVFAVFAALLWKRMRSIAVGAGLISVWALSAFLVVQFVFGFNRPLTLPLANFFLNGNGAVLDIGCGSGRATLAVAQLRPQARVVGLDNFSAEYIRNNGRDLFFSNARAAGVESRVDVVQADMRKIPSADGNFDAAISTYAIDHLGRRDIKVALAEVSRVLKPGSDFLLMVLQRDSWLLYVFGPAVIHSFDGPQFWADQLRNAGFDVVEQGTTPASAHFLCRKR